jgi:UDP-glucuronate 4-epimerase
LRHKVAICSCLSSKEKTIRVAGFIGSFVAQKLCQQRHDVIGLDKLNDYDDPKLKLARLKRIEQLANFRFVKIDLADRDGMDNLFTSKKF